MDNHAADVNRTISYHKNPRTNEPWGFESGFHQASINDLNRVVNCLLNLVWSPITWIGGIRRAENFNFSDWCALDFENPEYSLSQAQKDFCDCTHIIGTTENHQKSKGDASPMDRFRVVIPWSMRITNLACYTYNVSNQIKIKGADQNCADGARYFKPCKDIVSVSSDGFYMDVLTDVPPYYKQMTSEIFLRNLEEEARRYQITKRFPKYIDNFLKNGAIFSDGREKSCFSTAIYLFGCGFDGEQIFDVLKSAPFDRSEFNEREIVHAIKGAHNQIKKHGVLNV